MTDANRMRESASQGEGAVYRPGALEESVRVAGERLRREMDQAAAVTAEIGRELTGEEATGALSRAMHLVILRRARARQLREFAAALVGGGASVLFDIDWCLETAELLDGRTLLQAAAEKDK